MGNIFISEKFVNQKCWGKIFIFCNASGYNYMIYVHVFWTFKSSMYIVFLSNLLINF